MAQTRRDFIKKAAALSAASYVSMNLPIDRINLARADEGVAWHRGSCRLCGVGCRVELGGKAGVPMGLCGVSESRTNFGYVCMKGMHFWKCMRHPDRLTKPLFHEKKSDKFREISWEKALDIAATRFAEAHKAGGGAAVAYYGSGQALTEEAYFFQKIMRGGLQSNNVEGNPRLCMASAVGGYMSSFGADEPIGGYADLEKAHCFLFVGSNTAEAHPVLFRRIMRRKLDNPDKVKVINVDPRVSQTSRIADMHLQFKPENIRTAARWFATSKGTVSLWTMGLNQRKQGVWANNLMHNLHILTTQKANLVLPASFHFNKLTKGAAGELRPSGGAAASTTSNRRNNADKWCSHNRQAGGKSGSPAGPRRHPRSGGVRRR